MEKRKKKEKSSACFKTFRAYKFSKMGPPKKLMFKKKKKKKSSEQSGEKHSLKEAAL